MPDQTELSPLTPSPAEVGIAVLSLLHVALVALVIVQLLRGKMTLPHGVVGLIVLLSVPVVGPLLVLTWQGRVSRHRERIQPASEDAPTPRPGVRTGEKPPA